MNRPRTVKAGKGLLPRMEARPRRDGLVTYRYHPVGGKPINLGTDRTEAIRKVLDLTGEGNDAGTFGRLWLQYRDTPDWRKLAAATRRDYEQCWLQLEPRFAEVHAGHLRASHVARYMRVERAEAPVRANREVALLSNLCNLAIERGEAEANPCRQVRRNTEQPRTKAPATAALTAFLDWLSKQSPQRRVIGLAAEYAAVAGNRKVEFLDLVRPQVDRAAGVIRTKRAKQRGIKRGEIIEEIEITPKLADLLDRIEAMHTARDRDCLYLFPNRHGTAYTAAGFKAMWGKIMNAALEEKVITDRFTFHDLRAYYATTHKAERGALPDLHANPAITARVYDRNKVVKRKAL
ncbi:tyrosine-type recombinase/integrase [Cupriavidus gilardii]|uniref:Tyrosine-type recombinase/integrase n=1 Tax=Cupriavidus gilardii TaxID=82541 RepID=A0ABY4VUC5_9BURK|nr:tyrosine-type recombinase/integrase [Cupriavidus gilardii]USE78953.1 tyrosine-type recombinase/integrase [Cupriavidus gilardii]